MRIQRDCRAELRGSSTVLWPQQAVAMREQAARHSPPTMLIAIDPKHNVAVCVLLAVCLIQVSPWSSPDREELHISVVR